MKHMTLAAIVLAALTAISGCSSPKAGCDLLFESRSTDTIPYRIPAIAEMKRGTLLALADYRHCGSDIGFGRVDIHGRISKDSGHTWGEEFTLIEGTGTSGSVDCGFGDAAIVADRSSNDVLVLTVY